MLYFEDLVLSILNAAFKKHSSAFVSLLNFSSSPIISPTVYF